MRNCRFFIIKMYQIRLNTAKLKNLFFTLKNARNLNGKNEMLVSFDALM